MQAQSRSHPASDGPAVWPSLGVGTKLAVVVVCVVFVHYLVFLAKLLLLSRTPGSVRSLNLIPFRTIADYLFSNSDAVRRFSVGEVLGNVVAFLPLGACLPPLRRRGANRCSDLAILGGGSSSLTHHGRRTYTAVK
ncbi:VanZ family protein [Phycicoccus sp. M110.8]|uniref:VanZ family protein n=1 Tax=Phycicoccus sp. M110.8 TaxID=3075433 RepID=UPI0028FD38E2|nr:VanZ family protein [Phycicoccus sp. M110.8]MDU0314098.1 VanZ family protein [Phycicoccus sp. M110.8]